MAMTTARNVIPNGEWISLAKIINTQPQEPGKIDNAKGWVLNELRAKRLRYRFFLDDRKTFRHDLPDHFWELARIHWIWSTATFNSVTIHHIEVLLPRAGGDSLCDLHSRLKPKELISAEVARRKAAGNIPIQISQFSKELAQFMQERNATGASVRPLKPRTIENRLHDWKLWPPD